MFRTLDRDMTLTPINTVRCHQPNPALCTPQQITQLTQPKPTLRQKIWNVVSPVLNAAMGLFFYWTNSSIFALSFMIGIISDDHVEAAIKKIQDVWNTQPFNTCLIGGVGSLLGGVGTFLSLPVTICVGSIIYAANLGCTMSRKAQEIIHLQQTKCNTTAITRNITG